MNIIKYLLKKKKTQFLFNFNGNLNILYFCDEHSFIKICFAYTFSDSNGKKFIKEISFLVKKDNPFIDLFNGLKLKELNDYSFMDNFKKNNENNLFLNHIHLFENNELHKNFLKQFSSDFFLSITKEIIPTFVKKDIVLHLSKYKLSPFNFDFNKSMCTIIKDNGLSFNSIDINPELRFIFEHNMITPIALSDNFDHFVSVLDQKTLLSFFTTKNINFLYFSNESIRDNLILDNLYLFKNDSNIKLYSKNLQIIFILKLINDKNFILKLIKQSFDKNFFSNTFFNILHILNVIKDIKEYGKSENQNNKEYFYFLMILKEINIPIEHFINNIDIIFSNFNELIFNLEDNHLISYSDIDFPLNSYVEKLLLNTQIGYF